MATHEPGYTRITLGAAVRSFASEPERSVDTRTYMATFISALLAERAWWFCLSCRRTPLNERLIGSIPSELGVGCLDGRPPNTPLPFSHCSPPPTNFLLCLS